MTFDQYMKSKFGDLHGDNVNNITVSLDWLRELWDAAQQALQYPPLILTYPERSVTEVSEKLKEQIITSLQAPSRLIAVKSPVDFSQYQHGTEEEFSAARAEARRLLDGVESGELISLPKSFAITAKPSHDGRVLRREVTYGSVSQETVTIKLKDDASSEAIHRQIIANELPKPEDDPDEPIIL
jgi:hypothetical protein